MSRLDFTPAQVAQARHYTYALLSRLFMEGLNHELLPYVQAIPELASTLPATFNADEAAADYQHLFGFNLFPYESIFLDTTGLLGGRMTEVVWRSYQQAGFPVDTAAASPDHVGQELAFMAFLAGAEANAGEDSLSAMTQQMQQRQRDFLQAHLLRWLPPLVLAIQQQHQPVYTALVDLTLDLVHAHYAEIRFPGEIEFLLPAPPSLLDDETTGLKEIAAYLATPLYSGIYLSRDDIGHLARRQRLPRGFGGRVQMLVNLMRAAAQYEHAPALLAELQTTVAGWHSAYSHLAATLPGLAPWATAWQARAGSTAQLLNQMSVQAFI